MLQAIIINRERWNRLSKQQRNAAKALGIKPEKQRRLTPSVRVTHSPTPYYLRLNTQCKLCGSSTYQYFHMVLSSNKESLSAQRISEKDFPKDTFRQRDTIVSTCPRCFQVLLGKEKEELAKALIQVFPTAYIARISWKGIEGGNGTD